MALHAKAKDEPNRRFHALYDKLYREDVLRFAYRCCRANHGAPGVDGVRFEDIEANGVEPWFGELAKRLKEKTYQAEAIRRVARPDETALRLLAKQKIETGALPRAEPANAFAGNGAGLPCSLCEHPITEGDYEFEYVIRGGETFRFHLRCQAIWRLALAE